MHSLRTPLASIENTNNTTGTARSSSCACRNVAAVASLAYAHMPIHMSSPKKYMEKLAYEISKAMTQSNMRYSPGSLGAVKGIKNEQ